MPRIGGADHQRLTPFVPGDDGSAGEHKAGARPREARENEPGHHREKRHAGEDLDGRDQMPVIGLRMHVAIADRRQCFDGEIKERERPIAFGIGDRLVAEPIQKAEHGVERDKQHGGAAEKHRPVDRHRPMIEIGPEPLAQAESLDLPVTELNELRLCI